MPPGVVGRRPDPRSFPHIQVLPYPGIGLHGEDRPVRFSQTLDDNKGMVNGQANNVTYSSAINLVTLTGNVKVQCGGDVAEGAVITYNTKTEVYTINGSSKTGAKSAAKSGRVSVVIQPSSTQKTK